MSDHSQGPGWWLASDGRWYPPDSAAPTGPLAPTPQPTPTYGPPPGYGPPSGYGPPPGYGYAYGPQGPSMWGPPGPPSIQGRCTSSMVLGILSVIPCFYVLCPIFALIALPLGITSVRAMDRGEANQDGRGQAIAGIVLSAISLAFAALFVVLVIVASSAEAAG